ncbi:MAG: hypothetical protein HDQ91_04795 [Desulfovibrio sp.]|nr:hypothetical protein [Desulfovibrio sp.]
MSNLSLSTRVAIALSIWAAGLILFLGLGLWNVSSSRHDADNRLLSEAGRTAAQIAGLLSLPGAPPDSMSARAIAMAAMEDERVYAIKIQTRHGILEGQRRNYLWEPVAWDDEIAENCVQGMNPVKIGGKPDGVVEVWLSPRANSEDAGMLAGRERWRFLLFACVWTLALLLVLLQWGLSNRLREYWRQRNSASDPEAVCGLINPAASAAENRDENARPMVSAQAGHEFQCSHPDSWLITAGLFRQTFAHAPNLINRLYAEGEVAGLCHLGRMLEQAGPCIGAEPLIRAAQTMQAALNDPECAARALPVEECARILEETLAALGCNAGPRPTATTGS